MKNWQERTALMLGKTKMEKLKHAHVLVVGLGGVGAYAAEQLCRAGIGKLTIVDGDVVEMTNRNRQLPALISNQGQSKAEIMGQRFRDINPDIELHVINEYLKDERMIEVLEEARYDYVVDAIDTLSPKVFLIYHSKQLGLPIVSSMGAGGKLDPSLVQVSDIAKSFNCKLARMLRKRLYKLGIRKGVKVVFSPEEVEKERVKLEEGQNKKSTVGTISYMPPLFGCFCSSVVIRDLLEK
ncbi:tRNA threonylcarbamoyladenosine dehydratase [Gaoshiqia sediminis]|uniref:tRNA threonylcarbamoyladenosine dehydratase n=1 Tax=Gaoshiqia sediminis TaxID=2986998 RepID=A0AA41YBI5_9BACT|nr:tRNA threonylcarbamoyladenosine dehydratase [Gaoshiqia sediminis]MCW0484708.1 tRNA threonylcarbamoyladenosine dehydratase [Gaoshiqia sediminis]